MISSKQFVEHKFLNSFSDTIGAFEESNAMVAGGVFTALYTNKEVNDIDVYFRSKEDVAKFLTTMQEDCRGAIVSVTDKSMTLAFVPDMPPIQLIYSIPAQSLTEVFEYFDFSINMAGYDFKTKEFVYHEGFFSDLAARRLSFNPSTAFPLISALRVGKYKDRGYSISRKEMVKVLLQVASLNITSYDELKAAIGGLYGNMITVDMDEKEPFDLSKAIDVLSEQVEGDKFYSFLEKDNVMKSSMNTNISFEEMADILIHPQPFHGGWYFDARNKQCVYKNGYGSLSYVDLAVVTAFAPNMEVKKEPKVIPDTAIAYKWVNKNSKGEYRSHYDDTFEYKIFNYAEAGSDNGLFFAFGEDIKNATYRNKGVILACVVRKEDHIHSSQFKRCYPLHEISLSEVVPQSNPFVDNSDYSGLLTTSFDSDKYLKSVTGVEIDKNSISSDGEPTMSFLVKKPSLSFGL